MRKTDTSMLVMGNDAISSACVSRKALALVGAIFLVVVYSPPLSYYLAGASSQAWGSCAAALAILGMAMWGTSSRQLDFHWASCLKTVLLPVSLVVVFVLAHLAIASLFHEDWRPVNWTRALLSLGPLMLLLSAAGVLGRCLTVAPGAAVDTSAKVIAILMLLVVAWSLLGWQPESIRKTRAAMFPFTEPSHFALASTPFFMYFCATISEERKRFWALLGVLGVLWLMPRSLTFSVGALLIIAVSCPRRYLLPIGALFVLLHLPDSSYYTQRLSFVDAPAARPVDKNMSMLVYRQGWELLVHENLASWGWGWGFQQLGVFPPELPSSIDIQTKFQGRSLNLKDGSFVIAKLVSEFGVFGLLLALAYMAAWLKALVLLRKQAMCRPLRGEDFAPSNPKMILALSLFLGYGIDFFARGIGYFTGTALLFLSACAYLLYERRKLLRFI